MLAPKDRYARSVGEGGCADRAGTRPWRRRRQFDVDPVKQELRQRLRKVMAGVSPEERGTRSLRAAHRLFQEPEYIKAEIVMVFLSIETEADTTPIVLPNASLYFGSVAKRTPFFVSVSCRRRILSTLKQTCMDPS